MFARRHVPAAALLLGLLVWSGCGTDNTVSPTSQLDSTAPAAPANLRSEVRGSAPVLAWDASSDADVIGYDIYVYSPDPSRENAYVKLNSTPVSATEYVVTNAAADGSYYRVKAVDASSNHSASSSSTLVRMPPQISNPASDPADPGVYQNR